MAIDEPAAEQPQHLLECGTVSKNTAPRDSHEAPLVQAWLDHIPAHSLFQQFCIDEWEDEKRQTLAYECGILESPRSDMTPGNERMTDSILWSATLRSPIDVLGGHPDPFDRSNLCIDPSMLPLSSDPVLAEDVRDDSKLLLANDMSSMPSFSALQANTSSSSYSSTVHASAKRLRRDSHDDGEVHTGLPSVDYADCQPELPGPKIRLLMPKRHARSPLRNAY